MPHKPGERCLLCLTPKLGTSIEGEPWYFDNAIYILASLISRRGTFDTLDRITADYWERERYA